LCRLDNKPDASEGPDYFLKYYNLRRSHQGYRLTGRTPVQALQEALGLTELPTVVAASEGEEEAPAA
jgi:hypothetical protein